MATTSKDTTKTVSTNTKAANTKAANRAKEAMEGFQGKFNDMTGDLQKRAKEAAENAVEMSKTMVEFNRLNVEAMIESGRITAKGGQEIAKTNMKYLREHLEEGSKTLQASMSVGTPKEFFEKQTDFMRNEMDRVMDQVSKNSDAVMKLVSDAYKPIADRLGTISSELKKAA